MQIPITPTTTIHASRIPNRAPVSVFATRSPMSTKPPNAVRIPRKISKTRFTGSVPSSVSRREPVEAVGDRAQRSRDLAQPGGVRAASRDPDELDDLDRALDVRDQRRAQVVRGRARRLNRNERV